MTVEIKRAAERFRTVQHGIISHHCFAAGSHYDPTALAFGSLVGFDEHVLAPGARFPMHAHRGVDIVTYVLSGVLAHEDSLGNRTALRAGSIAHLRAGSGARHEEGNTADEPLRLLQATVLGASEVPPEYRMTRSPVVTPAAILHVLSGPSALPLEGRAFGFVARGPVRVDPVSDDLVSGDSFRITEVARLELSGSGTPMLIVIDVLT
jgi:quercetin 2,3-dioxygenase